MSNLGPNVITRKGTSRLTNTPKADRSDKSGEPPQASSAQASSAQTSYKPPTAEHADDAESDINVEDSPSFTKQEKGKSIQTGFQTPDWMGAEPQLTRQDVIDIMKEMVTPIVTAQMASTMPIMIHKITEALAKRWNNGPTGAEPPMSADTKGERKGYASAYEIPVFERPEFNVTAPPRKPHASIGIVGRILPPQHAPYTPRLLQQAEESEPEKDSRQPRRTTRARSYSRSRSHSRSTQPHLIKEKKLNLFDPDYIDESDKSKYKIAIITIFYGVLHTDIFAWTNYLLSLARDYKPRTVARSWPRALRGETQAWFFYDLSESECEIIRYSTLDE